MTGKLLKPCEVADALQVSVQTLANWRCKGVGPEYIKLGQGLRAPVRYLPVQSVADVEKETKA